MNTGIGGKPCILLKFGVNLCKYTPVIILLILYLYRYRGKHVLEIRPGTLGLCAKALGSGIKGLRGHKYEQIS